MKNTRQYLMSLVTIVIVAAIFSATVAAQGKQWVADRKYVNNPCSNPQISWALWNESAGFNAPTGGSANAGDCDPSNYGTWATAPQLEANLRSYRQLLSRGGLTTKAFVGVDGQRYVAIKQSGNLIAGFNKDGNFISAAAVVAAGAGNFDIKTSRVVAAGAGNDPKVVKVVAAGAGNLATKAANVVAAGAGNFRGVKSLGDIVIQFPGKWARIR